ncbi:hypothetical protein DL770_010173 [Monosporascus sp. CRB-9-2]|nr:hypothetical protein DL770_010173 [Monosporascus sp. CRB-9-2]
MDNSHWDTVSNRRSVFCSLCGVAIDPSQADLNGNPELSWLNEVRAVRTTHLVSDPFVTGVGYLSFQQEVYTPRDEGRRYDDEDHGPSDGAAESFLQAQPVFNSSREYWCYVVHDACWELLRDRIDPGRQMPTDTIARHLFALLYNTPTNGEGTLVPGHDYGGAAQFQLPSRYGYFTVVDSSGLPYLTGDPREELQRDEDCMREAIQAMSAPFNLPGMSLGNYSDSDVFCSLPNEVVMHIVEYLPSSDVVNIRLASRYVADTSSPNLLPQEFWASRFWPGSEMGFVFAQPFCPRPSKLVDWRLLYIKAKATLSNPEPFPGFRNRKRIWHNLQNLSDALRIRIENEDWVTDTPYRDPRLVMPPASRLGPVLSAETSLEPFYIDGPNGEVITKVRVGRDVNPELIQSLTLFTNRGRSAQFCLPDEVVKIPLHRKTDIEPKEGELLTAFCAKVMARRDTYPDCHVEVVRYSSGYQRGFAFTTAELSDVREVRVSVGKEGRSRPEKHISGIWLDYRDSTPAVVGQWIQENGSLALEPGDRITQVTTWHDFTNSYRHVMFGPIVKIRLCTAAGTTKEFLNPTAGGSVCLSYRENPYEELRGITWGYNCEWDHVRILYGPRPGSRGNPLITVPPPSRRSNGLWHDGDSDLKSWMVPEKAFLVEGRSGAEDGEGPVVAIEVSYKDLSAEPAGLTLVYRGGAERTLGALGKRPQRQELLPGETLTRMEVGLVRRDRIAFLSFFTDTNRKLHFSDARAATTATTTPAPQLSSRACVLAEAGRVQGTGDGVEGVQDPTRMDGLGAFVGLWAVPRRNGRSLRHNLLGPLFETNDVGEG